MVFLNKFIILGFLILALTSSVCVFAGPFDEGTKKTTLSQSDRANLLQYADSSKSKLEKALQDADGLDLDEKTGIYWKAIQEVVIDSYQNKPRSELLMRYALNQGLDLTFGIPDANGMYSPGALSGAANSGLFIMILEDSIQLAISYYKDDREAIEQGALDSLPYARFAEDRLAKGKYWLTSVLEDGYQFRGSMNILRHWFNTITADDDLVQTLFAEEIVLVDDILKNEAFTTSMLVQKPEMVLGEVRHLRSVLEQLENSVKDKNVKLNAVQEEKRKKLEEQLKQEELDRKNREAKMQQEVEAQKNKQKQAQEQAAKSKEEEKKLKENEKRRIQEENERKKKDFADFTAWEKGVLSRLAATYRNTDQLSPSDMIALTEKETITTIKQLDYVVAAMPVGVKTASLSATADILGKIQRVLPEALWSDASEVYGLSNDLYVLFSIFVEVKPTIALQRPDVLQTELRIAQKLRSQFLSKMQRTYAWKEQLTNTKKEDLKVFANKIFDKYEESVLAAIKGDSK